MERWLWSERGRVVRRWLWTLALVLTIMGLIVGHVWPPALLVFVLGVWLGVWLTTREIRRWRAGR